MKFLMITLITLTSLNSFAQESPSPLNCHGTEPFWGAKITDDKISLNIAGEDDEQFFYVINKQAALGFTENFITTYSDSRGPVAVVKSATCNNGMSDDEFGKEVMIFTSRGTLYGCCGPSL